MKLCQKGMLLADLLTALLLCSISGLLIGKILVPAIHTQTEIYSQWKWEKDFRIVVQQLKQDLSWQVLVRKEPFSGNEKEITFMIRVWDSGWIWKKVHYRWASEGLIREIVEMKENFNTKGSSQKKIYKLKGKFQFLMQDREKNLQYSSAWKKGEVRPPRVIKVAITNPPRVEESLLTCPAGIVPVEEIS